MWMNDKDYRNTLQLIYVLLQIFQKIYFPEHKVYWISERSNKIHAARKCTLLNHLYVCDLLLDSNLFILPDLSNVWWAINVWELKNEIPRNKIQL